MLLEMGFFTEKRQKRFMIHDGEKSLENSSKGGASGGQFVANRGLNCPRWRIITQGSVGPSLIWDGRGQRTTKYTRQRPSGKEKVRSESSKNRGKGGRDGTEGVWSQKRELTH